MTSTSAGQDFPRDIGRPATGALVAAGYTQLSQLDGVPAADLRKLHGMGPVALERLQKALQATGMSLA